MSASILKAIAVMSSARQWKTLQFVLAIILTLLFLFVRIHAPIELAPYQGYDDQLYMSLGRNLANGHWLGRYNAWTLVKGPGFPWFLAFSAWLGTPITLTTAIFHCLSLGIFYWVLARIYGKPALALWGYIFTLWTPAPYLNRITRDQVYPGQVMLLVATLFGTFFIAKTEKSRRAWALCCGVTAGWLTLTREEGIWVAPMIAFVVLFAAYKSWKKQTLLNSAVKPALILLLSFLAVQVAFVTGNRIKYHAWVSVETNSYPFKDALGVLQSVDAGTRIPYVPVSREARKAIYSISPTFSTLKPFLDPTNGSPWLAPGCRFYPQTCGEISGGFFIWAFRDAVAKTGHYLSPHAASDFYKKLISEVQHACHEGKLKCSPPLIALIPPISKQQWQKLPSSLNVGIRKITFEILPSETGFSMGPRDQMAIDLAFLGYPRKSPEENQEHLYELRGWYRSDDSSDWPSVKVDSDGQVRSEILMRNPSPDLVAAFRNASHQRFDFYITCRDPCSVTFVTSDKVFPSFDPQKMLGRQWSQNVGNGVLNIDSINMQMDSSDAPDMRTKLSVSIQSKDIHLYSHMTPLLGILAVISTLGMLMRSLIIRNFTITMALSAAVWILLGTRLLLLGLVDISSFPGMIVPYLAPAYVLMSAAIFLSFAALMDSFNNTFHN